MMARKKRDPVEVLEAAIRDALAAGVPAGVRRRLARLLIRGR